MWVWHVSAICLCHVGGAGCGIKGRLLLGAAAVSRPVAIAASALAAAAAAAAGAMGGRRVHRTILPSSTAAAAAVALCHMAILLSCTAAVGAVAICHMATLLSSAGAVDGPAVCHMAILSSTAAAGAVAICHVALQGDIQPPLWSESPRLLPVVLGVVDSKQGHDNGDVGRHGIGANLGGLVGRHPERVGGGVELKSLVLTAVFVKYAKYQMIWD